MPPFATPDEPLVVLHLDDHLVAVAKPSGLLSVPGRGDDKQDCVAARVQARVPDALVVHRLDMSTSGVMVFARGKTVQRQLGDRFAGREVHKQYIAIVDGVPQPPDGRIDLPLSTDWPNRPLQQVDHAHGKPSLTHYRTLGPGPALVHGPSTRLALEPVTGRSHQLRVHLRAIGHPIVGDALYAEGSVRDGAGRLLLHAESLTLPHPATGQSLRLHCPAPF